MSAQERISTVEYRRRVGLGGTPSKSKFGNKKTPADDGVVMDSGREATRYKDLVRMQEAGQIASLRRQVTYALVVNDVHICDYVADFVYVNCDKLVGKYLATVVEDSKGARTPIYKLKRALMKACRGIEVVES